jgi:hypothetical protein
MPRKSPYTIMLAEDERQHLQHLAHSYTSPYRDVVRAKIVLFAAEGLDNDAIGHRLDLDRQIVSKWRKRFFLERVGGLSDRLRGGRPPRFSPTGRGGGQGPGL